MQYYKNNEETKNIPNLNKSNKPHICQKILGSCHICMEYRNWVKYILLILNDGKYILQSL